MDEHHVEIMPLPTEAMMRLDADYLASSGRPRWRMTGWRRLRVTFKANPGTNPRVVGPVSVEGRPFTVLRVYRSLTSGTAKLPSKEA